MEARIRPSYDDPLAVQVRHVFDVAPDRFRVDFRTWLRDNWSIFGAFYSRAYQMQTLGREHYSARTIIEVLRWDSDIRDSGYLFKIDGNWVPDMARLYNELTGTKFFQERGR